MDDSIQSEKQYTGENTGPGTQPLSAEQQLSELVGQYLPVTEHEDRHWVRNSEPDSKQRYAIIGQHGAISSSGAVRCRFMIDSFIPSTASNPKSKKLLIVRNRTIGRGADGSPVYPGFSVDAWKFCLAYSPEEGWMTKSEWRQILAELAPVISADRLSAEGEDAWRERGRVKAADAHLAQQNPSAHLAAALATGIASALKELGLKPKAS